MTDSVLHVPARDIPVPTSVSPEAQAVLAVVLLTPGVDLRFVDEHWGGAPS